MVDPVADDVKVVILLNDFISHLLEDVQKRSEHGIHGNQKFLCHTLDFLTYLQHYYSRNAGNNCLISDILSQLRQLLVIVSETVYISASTCICEDATENVVTVSTRTKSQLRELLGRTNNVTEVVVTLQNTAHEFLKKSSKTKMLTLLDEDKKHFIFYKVSSECVWGELVRDSSAIRRLFVRLAGAVGCQIALHK